MEEGIKMLLAVDIGNTSIVLGGLEGKRIAFQTRLSTLMYKGEAEYAVLFKNLLSIYGVDTETIEGCIISSVVPPLNTVMKNVLQLLTGKQPLIVGPGVKTGLNVIGGDAKSLGADLVVAAVAALEKYPKPMIIIDMGTATTLSVIDASGAFRGGVIYPGVMVSFEALARNTAQLPRIDFEEPRQVISINTVDSMQSGLIYGSAGMIDGLIDRISNEFGHELTLVATGGMSEKIVPHCRHSIRLDNDLLLDGLRIIYEKNRKKK